MTCPFKEKLDFRVDNNQKCPYIKENSLESTNRTITNETADFMHKDISKDIKCDDELTDEEDNHIGGCPIMNKSNL